MKTKLIILRGPSGSGKSTIAKEIRKVKKSEVAFVEQDYLRRIILKEKDIFNGKNIKLIFQTVRFALDNGYNTILEGILYSKHYKDMIIELLKVHPEENYFYYIDIPFEETLRRHMTKPNAHEFGEKEMREWYAPKDYLNLEGEKIIDDKASLEKITKQILQETGLWFE